MPYEYTKSEKTTLRALSLDERWLQERIAEDPSILGLGDLTLIRREKKQITGGRIDFLLFDPEEDTRYAVEVMLGQLDESHIIRTIEYWDVERTKNRDVEHRAVIVAEDITIASSTSSLYLTVPCH
jgi:RecB family endonuclease NucS